MRRATEGFVGALRFLTVAPLPGARLTPPSQTVTPWFPVVGLLLGWALAGLRWSLPGEGLLPAAIVVAAWTAMTGGLHEDGWADCADTALPPVSRARRLEILRDPRVGAHGLVAVLLLLLMRFAALSDVAWRALPPPPIVGRWACGLVVGTLLSRRFGGLSEDGQGAVGLAAETGALCGLAILGAAAASEMP